MSTKYAIYLTVCVATIAFVAGLALPVFVDLPVFWYRPAERAWLFAVHPPGVAMDFFGRCLLAVAIAAVTTAIVYPVTRRVLRRDPTSATVTLFGAWTITLAGFAIAFFAWHLANRTPIPPPIPSWYQPR
jgi:hypothetical protein